MGKVKSVDLVARKGNQKLAFEVETGKNSLEQIIENISKSLSAGFDRIYLIPTSARAYKKFYRLLGYDFLYDPGMVRIIPFSAKREFFKKSTLFFNLTY